MNPVLALQDTTYPVNDPLPVVDQLVDTRNVTGWSVLFAVIAVVVGWVLSRLARRGLERLLTRWPTLPVYVTTFAVRAAGWLIMFLAVVYALSLLGFDMSPVVIGLLIVLVVLVLSGRPLLEDFGAGIILQARSPFVPGDQVASHDYVGAVDELNARALVLVTLDGERVYIPNRKVLEAPIVNYTEHGARRTVMEVGVRYGTDLDRARRVLHDTVVSVSGVHDDPPPEVLAEEFDDSAIDFEVHFWHDAEILAGLRVRDDVTRAIDRALKGAAIVIAFPQRTLWWGEPPAASEDPSSGRDSADG